MYTAKTDVTRLIEAKPAEIYAILVDYKQEHPNILPKQYFTKLEVLQGGVGAGTVIKVFMNAMGSKRVLEMEVAEPEPGRVLTEKDRKTGTLTSFIVTPLNNGEQSQVQIITDWIFPAGFSGFFEKLITPPIARRIYQAELAQLAEYVKSKPK